jgi:hypothetical protein
LPENTEIDLAIDQLAGPVYYRVLVTRQAVPPGFTDTLVDRFLAPPGQYLAQPSQTSPATQTPPASPGATASAKDPHTADECGLRAHPTTPDSHGCGFSGVMGCGGLRGWLLGAAWLGVERGFLSLCSWCLARTCGEEAPGWKRMR